MATYLRLFLASAAFLGATCAGQTIDDHTAEAADAEATLTPALAPGTTPLVWTLRSRGGYWFDADFDGAAGSVSRWNAGIDLSVKIPLDEGHFITLNVASGLTEFDFSGESGLVPGDDEPWDTVVSHSFWVGGYKKTDHQTLFGGVILASDGAPDAPFEDTLTIGGAAGFSKVISEDLSLGLGVAVQSRLEDDPLIVPFPVVRWTPDFDPERRWSVGIGAAPGGPSREAGAGIEFSPSDTLTYSLSLRAAGVGADFRLDDDAPVPEGVGRDQSLPLYLGVEWTPKTDVHVRGFLGASFSREIELQDRDGNTVSERDVDPAVVLGVAVSVAF